MRIRSVFSLALSMTVVACAIRPLPKNVTRDTTVSIVKKIRCEARDALISQVLESLAKSNFRQTRGLVPRLESGQLSFLSSKFITEKLKKLRESETPNKISSNEQLIIYWEGLIPLEKWDMMVDPDTLKKINKFQWSTISYKFTFTITETNNKTANALFKMPFTRGIFTLGLKAGSEKSRANERILQIADPFGAMLKELDCEFDHRPRKHWIYPITGNIGLDEVVDTWIDLQNSQPSGISTFSDELTFITKFLGQVKPAVTISDPTPLKLKKFRLASASIDANASRNDQHKLLISLAFVSTDPSVLATFEEIPLADGVILKIEKPSAPPSISLAPRPQGILPSTPTQYKILRQKGIRELNRLDSLNRQRDLNELIGR